ncbi:DUF1553 domain-containing protein [Pedobacter sp. MW01-1-1]|uniref:DUF1553 domain-containing protein n=1 Tax=Pedobacter sp. MW01-1-1 TaxID=3383027 RepID=UPI003FEF6411
MYTKKKVILFIVFLSLASLVAFSLLSAEKQVDFNTEIKPILNKKCISCHGGVKQQGGFSVLFREEALAVTKSGKPAILVGDPENSEFIKRLKSNDPELRMPYKHEALKEEEINLFSRWIKQGAKWGKHWAYVAVQETVVPDVDADWAETNIDKFVYEKLQEQQLNPSDVADKAILLRRLGLDLVGLYPTEKQVETYMHAKDERKAYEKMVDELLASPEFGEKWASMWLDVARYADTKGYERDGGRTIWPYRDWVIRAFNTDMPYNQFITEQIAGDLLPNPTDQQYIATAFSRNTPTNDEGGTNNEEFRVSAVLDRVNTTWEGLMSTTFACVQCHSHPYDPFKHDEYYKFSSYFNNSRDEDVMADYPLFRQFNDSTKHELDKMYEWVKTNEGKVKADRIKLFIQTGQPSINSTTAIPLKNAVIANGNVNLQFRDQAVARLSSVDLRNADQLIMSYRSKQAGGKLTMRMDAENGPVIKQWTVDTAQKQQVVKINFPKQNGIHDVYLRYENPSFARNTGKSDEKSKEKYAVFFDWFHFGEQFPGKGKPGYEQAKRSYDSLLIIKAPGVPIMVENPDAMRRENYVFERGAWTSKGKKVTANVPQSLAFAMPKNAPNNRLGLAMWLTDKRNPLVSRTIVNKLWEQIFGIGLVETLEDMGTQGIPPTHQELLDYMAYRFMHNYNWSIKKMIKEMVMSATYRQSSIVTKEQKEKDPFNKYYARGSRVRLSAEQMRDQCLQVSGALNLKKFGPPVMPWQPEGIWQSPYNSAKWKTATGDEQYRRAIYTYWKRTSPYPSAIAFDGVSRVICSPRRIRTNTPLQALVTLNDSVYVDLARKFAHKMDQPFLKTPAQKIAKGYELMLFKKIPTATLQIFEELYQDANKTFKKNPASAAAFLGKKGEKVNPEKASLVLVANAMLNLDEVITKN